MINNNSWLNHDRLTTRYRFAGVLELKTGLHIGNGLSSTLTDAQIIRTANGAPYIPGSSFKGALRSAVERIAPNIRGIETCLLIPDGDCLTVSSDLRKRLQDIRENSQTAQRSRLGYGQLSNVDKDDKNWLIDHSICSLQDLDSPDFARELPYRFIERTLCHTCQLFGSTEFAAKLRVSDLHIQGHWLEMTEIRDGVGIDRDTETAKPGIKFNLEVLPSETEFAFQLDAENLNERDLGLLCMGLQEFRAGGVPLGGRSSRGLGQCQLTLENIYWTDLTNSNALIRYLTATEDAERMTAVQAPTEIDQFISTSIHALFQGESHAKKAS